MKLKWEKIQARSYRAILNGLVVAEVHNTSQTQAENYPWDWYTIGNVKVIKHNSGVAESLKAAKQTIEYELGG